MSMLGPTKKSFRDRVLGPSDREKYLDSEMKAVVEVLTRLRTAEENGEIGGFATIAEGMRDIEMMIDAQGWTNVFEYDDDMGLTLGQIKDASRQLRELVVGNPFVKNGFRIRHANTWGGGQEFNCRNRTGRNLEVRSLPAKLQDFMEDVANQRYLFGNDAHEEMEAAAFTDGMFFALGEDATNRMQRVQLHEISADLRNPNNTEEIWAYRRIWYQNPTASDLTARVEMVRWYYTDIYPGKRRASIKHGGKLEKVERGYTMIDKAFNRQVGWAYGVPDALCIVAWARLYKEFLTNGYVMSRSLARLAFKVTSQSATGAKTASTEVALPGQAGGTAVEGAGNNLQPLLTAGRGYDFSSGSPLAAAMAAGLGISLLAITANPAAATGSNAAAATLTPIERATAQVRRGSWDDFWLRLFRYRNLSQRLVVTWFDLADDQVQRAMQAVTLLDGLEVVGAPVIQGAAARAMQIANPGPVPPGWKTKSQRGSNAADDPRNTGGNSGATGGSGQGGDDDGTGDTGNDHDTDQD